LSERNILMLLQTEFPPDIRLAKEIKALNANGYTVHILCNNNTNKPLQEKVQGAFVHRLPVFDHLPAKLQKIKRMPYSFNRLWIKQASHIIKEHQIHSIHAHDLPMAPIGIKLAKKFKLKLVYDMHENYPAAMAEWNKGASLSRKIFKNAHIGAMLDKYCIKRADRIIVVVDEMRDLLINRGESPDKIYVVSNTVDADLFANAEYDQKIIDQYKDQYTILYLGTFSIERGLGTAISAMHDISKHIPSAKLLLVGGGAYEKQLKEYVQKEKASDYVEFGGWVTFDKVPSYMKAADICIVPQPSNPFIDTTIPHKIFQYMAVGKPVLTSDASPLKRIVVGTACGEYFKSEDPQSFSQAIQKIHASKTAYAENGQKAIKEKYNWENSSTELIKLYHQLYKNIE